MATPLWLWLWPWPLDAATCACRRPRVRGVSVNDSCLLTPSVAGVDVWRYVYPCRRLASYVHGDRCRKPLPYAPAAPGPAAGTIASWLCASYGVSTNSSLSLSPSPSPPPPPPPAALELGPWLWARCGSLEVADWRESPGGKQTRNASKPCGENTNPTKPSHTHTKIQKERHTGHILNMVPWVQVSPAEPATDRTCHSSLSERRRGVRRGHNTFTTGLNLQHTDTRIQQRQGEQLIKTTHICTSQSERTESAHKERREGRPGGCASPAVAAFRRYAAAPQDPHSFCTPCGGVWATGRGAGRPSGRRRRLAPHGRA